MDKIQITKEQAQRFLICYHGLHEDFRYKGKQGIMDYIKKVGCIQYDPLNIVGRNPDLVLQSRIKGYKADMLQELLYQDRLLLDEWDKEMSIYPVVDWPYFERNRKAAFERYREIKDIQENLPYIRKALDKKGPLTSSDLELTQSIDWAWAPTRLSRAALESMYLWGELIVHNKVGTRKQYDFAHKHLPSGIIHAPDPNQTLLQYHAWHVLRRIGAVGLLWNKAGDAWLGIKEMKSKERNEAFAWLLNQKRIMEIMVEGLKDPLYFRSEYESLLKMTLEEKVLKTSAAILAPLDNMLWDRKLIKELFGFEYTWEVYKPAEQRKYGYYVLPVLYGSKFVARFEPVLDKEIGALLIKNWWWEPGVRTTAKMRKTLEKSLINFMEFTGSDRIINDLSNF